MALIKKVKKETTPNTATETKAKADVAPQEVVAEVEKEVVEEVEQVEEVVEEVVAEVVAEVVEEVAEPTQSTVGPAVSRAVRANPENSAVGSLANYTKEAEESGFSGMEVGGFGSFPTIVLGSDGMFECDDDDWGNDSFIGQLQNSRQLYLCKQVGVSDGPCAFTYDQKTLNSPLENCTTVADLKNAWEEDGETMEIKEYLEVLIEIVEEGHDHEGEYFIVKIPPSSINPFRGKVFIANKKNNTPFSEICIEFIVGKKRTKGTNKYYPWKFQVVKA